MKGKYIWIALAVSAALFSACEKEQYLAPDKSKYIYDIPQTTLPTDAIVGVYYNNYTSPVSSTTSAEVPTLGYYATADEGVLAQHIAWADEAGIDFFIVTWDGSSSTTALLDRFIEARMAGGNVKFVICYNTSHLNVTNESPLEKEANYKVLLSDFVDVLAKYVTDEAYYTLDGKPVILMTPANLGSDALLSINYRQVIRSLKSDLNDFYGVVPFFIGQITTGWVAPVNYADHQVYSFDAVVASEWKTRAYDVFYGFFSFLDINWNNWKTTLEKRNVDFIPCVYPSYNDRIYSKNSYYYTFGNKGDEKDYVTFCNVAKRNIGSRNLVFVNSWNNWNYGTNLEPSEEKSTRFLATTKSQFKK